MATTYTIRSGDTLSQIAAANKTTISAIQAINPQITDINKIYAGATLNLPTSTGSYGPFINVPQTPSVFSGGTSQTQTSAQTSGPNFAASNLGIGNTAPSGTTLTREQQLAQIASGIQDVANQIPAIQTSVNTLSQAQQAGMTITPQTSVQDATQYLTTQSPELPSGTTNPFNYLGGLANELATTKNTLYDAYQKQIDSLKAQQETAQSKIDEYMSKEQGAIGNIEQLTQPFQQQLEESERQRLHIEENFFANQNSVKELEDLLNQAMTDIEAARGVTGLSSIRAPRIAKIQTDYEARTGIIQAVMAARNNQIAVGTNLIDRSINAIQNDRNNQLGYYKTVLNFYDNLRTEEGNKLINLTKDERTYINAQIGMLENDMNNAQKTADYVKQLMIDPNTANAMEQAGVTLNDSVEQINSKLSQYAYTKEVQDTSNQMQSQGFTPLLQQQVASKPANEVMTLTDSKGNKTYWWKQGGTSGTTSGMPETQGGFYWDTATQSFKEIGGGGREYSDTELEAEIRTLQRAIQSEEGRDIDFQEMVDLLTLDTKIANKDRAIEIAKNIYGISEGGEVKTSTPTQESESFMDRLFGGIRNLLSGK